MGYLLSESLFSHMFFQFCKLENVYIIDPKVSTEDKELRDTLQREKLV